MAWDVFIDPPAVASGRTQLALNDNNTGILIDQQGIDWGQGAISQFLADMKHGSVPVDFRIPNRTIAIPLFLFTPEDGVTDQETARRLLEEKVGLIHREGGWLMRQRAGGQPLYADIIDATLQVPDRWGETGQLEPEVQLVLTCLPDFYGDEVALDTVSGNKWIEAVLKQSGVNAVIPGDYPGRTRIQVTDQAGANINAIVWAFRSRYYSSAGSAALVKTAQQLPLLNNSTLVNDSTGLDGHIIQNTNLTRHKWVPICELSTADIGAGTGFTHQGTYAVIARVKGHAAPVHVRLLWQVGDLGVPEENDPVLVPDDASATEGGAAQMYEIDLGMIRLEKPPTAKPYGWYGMIQAQTHKPSLTFQLDSVIFVPIDEAAGLVRAKTHFDTPNAVGHDSEIETAASIADDASVGGRGWTSLNGDGDVPFVTSMTQTYTSGTEETTHYFKATNLGFAIPAGATIVGIKVEVLHSYGEALSHKRGGEPYVQDKYVRLIKAGTIQTTGGKSRQKPWHRHLQWEQYGDSRDVWSAGSGTTWTPSDINNAGFGFAIAAAFGVASTGDQVWLKIDNFKVRVYYTHSASGTVQQDAVVYQNRSAEIRTEGVWHTDPTGSNSVPAAEVEGSEPRIPSSGAEQRPVELLLYTSRGDHRHRRHHRHHRHDPDTTPNHNLIVQVFYRPCYLGRI